MAESVSASTRTDITIGVDNSERQKTDAQHTITVLKANETVGIKMELNDNDVKVESSEKVVTVETGSTKTVDVKTIEIERKVTESEIEEFKKISISNGSDVSDKKTDLELKRRSESPSEELVDSIEEEAFSKTMESDLQNPTKVDSGNDLNDDYLARKPSTYGGNSKDNNENDCKSPEKEENKHNGKDEQGEGTLTEEISKSVPSDNNTGEDGKLEQAAGGHIVNIVKSKEREEVNEEFFGMTEDEIQAIISKYSFMDRSIRNRCLRFFWSLDVERCGYFNFHQFLYWYQVQGTKLTTFEVASIFNDLDHDKDRLVSLEEFLNEMSRNRPRLYTQEELREQFEEFDKNKDGYVCEDDIIATMKSRGLFYTLPMVWNVLEYDHSGDHKRLDFLDFSRYMQDTMRKRMPDKQWR